MGQVGEAVDPVTGLMPSACWALTSSRDVTGRVRTIETQDLRGWTRDLSKTQPVPAVLDPNSSSDALLSGLKSWDLSVLRVELVHPTDLRPKKRRKSDLDPLTRAGFGVCFGDEGNVKEGWR